MPSLTFTGLSKSFPGVLALDGVSFGVEEGCIHGLIGENGAGKSTLLKILSGVYRPTSGRLEIAGQPQRFRSAREALAAGIAVIYQELNLVPELSIAENLYLGHLPARAGIVKWAELARRAAEQLALVGEELSPHARVGRLPIAQRQMVEIAKALSRGAKIIAFDEPTSSLSAREVERLFGIIRKLKQQGCVVLYVSHRLEEILHLCDSVTVLRDGRHVQTFDTLNDVTAEVLISHMVGRSLDDIYGYVPRQRGGTVLEVTALEGPGLRAPVSLSVAAGEIVGLFGLVGAGRSELCKLIYGATRPKSGTVRLAGAPVALRSPRESISHGLMFCPEDRKQEGVIPIRSVQENLNLSARRRHTRLGFFLNETWERANAREHIDRLSIRTPSPQQLIRNLSGGNQQKVILARWLSESIRVLLLDEPTRGIDVGAKREIYDLMYQLAGQGIGILMVSSELPEVLGVADRILVMREGRLAGELAREAATSEQVLQLALPHVEANGVAQ